MNFFIIYLDCKNIREISQAAQNMFLPCHPANTYTKG